MLKTINPSPRCATIALFFGALAYSGCAGSSDGPRDNVNQRGVTSGDSPNEACHVSTESIDGKLMYNLPDLVNQNPQGMHDVVIFTADDAAQQCVIGTVEELGGTVIKVTDIGKTINALVSGEAVQVIASRTDVTHIVPSDTGAQPP